MNQESPLPRKTVLFLITKATWGGAQRYVYDIASHLPRDRFEPGLAYGQEGRLAELFQSEGLPTLQIPALTRDVGLVSDVLSLRQIFTTLQRAEPDILHLNSSKAAALGAVAARVLGVRRIVFTVHGWPFKENRNALARFFIYMISWFTAALSHAVIVVSKADRAIAERMWLVRKKVIYVSLGRERPALALPDDGFRAMFGAVPVPHIKPDTLRLTTIAELTANKGIHYAIDAVAELAHREIDAIYTIAGEGEDHSELARYAHERGVGDRVFFAGFVADAAKNLRGFDILLLPSVKEGMPYVLIEAAAAGIPVVATDIVREDFEQFPQFTFVPSRDGLALADAIEQVAKKPSVQPLNDPFPIDAMVQATSVLYEA